MEDAKMIQQPDDNLGSVIRDEDRMSPEMVEVYRLKTPKQRLQIAFGMCRSGQKIVAAAVKRQLPDATNEERQREVARRSRMDSYELLLYAAKSLDKMNVNYLVTGSLATMTYGEARFTNDVDIVANFLKVELELQQVLAS